MKLSYDLHMHSCLSPCGDADMTPNNMVNMAILNGLQVVALTDHNSCKNCPAFLEVARRSGILAIAGMELCTAEEIHVVCLFPELAAAMAFDEEVYHKVPDIQNRPEIFGEQWVMDENDAVLRSETRLLINASAISITEAVPLVKKYGGVVFPAHVDKSAYSVLSNLGFLPPECGFTTVEVKSPESFLANEENRQKIAGCQVVTDSDAHYLWDIAEPVHTLELSACSAGRVLEYFRGKEGDF